LRYDRTINGFAYTYNTYIVSVKFNAVVIVNGPNPEGKLFIFIYHPPVKGRNILNAIKKIHNNAVTRMLIVST
jgi:hypothetical protein